MNDLTAVDSIDWTKESRMLRKQNNQIVGLVRDHVGKLDQLAKGRLHPEDYISSIRYLANELEVELGIIVTE